MSPHGVIANPITFNRRVSAVRCQAFLSQGTIEGVKRVWTPFAIVAIGILIAVAVVNGWYNG